jgi:hypothetical protein
VLRLLITVFKYKHNLQSEKYIFKIVKNVVSFMNNIHLFRVDLTGKYWTRLETLARDKHSSLLRTFANYGREKFHSIGPRVFGK